MNKPLFLLSLLCVSQISASSAFAQNSFYGHDRTWSGMKTVNGQTVPSDYLVPAGSSGEINRSTAPFGAYQTRTARAAAVDPRVIQARRMQAMQQQRARQIQQQQLMRQQQMYAQQQQSGAYYTPGQNAQSQSGYTTNSSGAATYTAPAAQQIYRPGSNGR